MNTTFLSTQIKFLLLRSETPRPMSAPTDRNSGSLFLTLSSYNRLRRFTSRRSDSSASDAESIQPPSPSDPSQPQGEAAHGSDKGKSRKWWYMRRNSHSGRESGVKRFPMAVIQKITENFSPTSWIGEGAFNTAYKGRLDDGTVVAVKRAKKSALYHRGPTELQNEIQIMASIEHLNLVRFFGYSEYKGDRILVIEYVPNGTLMEHLDGLRGNHLDLAARLEIAIDIAHAVSYLHTHADPPIIHRDIKPSNIFLTENLRAKVGNFHFACNATEAGEEVIAGTPGYIDPEYLRTLQLTVKSDVYSFGVLLLELISRRRPIEGYRGEEQQYIIDWATEKYMEGNAIQTLDRNIQQTPGTDLVVKKILELALQCSSRTRQEDRPSMSRCAEILWGIRNDHRELSSSDVILPS